MNLPGGALCPLRRGPRSRTRVEHLIDLGTATSFTSTVATGPVRRSDRAKLGATVAGMAIAVAFVIHSVWSTPPPTTELPCGDQQAVTVADGELPDGVTVFDDRYPGVTRLNSALLNALRKAATDAAGEAIEVYVNSGWRSPAYQDVLLREAVSRVRVGARGGAVGCHGRHVTARVRGRGRRRAV